MDGLGRAGGAEARVWLLYEVASDLGAPLYPALIRVLCAVERFGDAGARRLVCDTLAYAARTWRAPPGRIEAWGGAAGEGGFELGPAEYLVVWHAQQDVLGPLSRAGFAAAMRLLLGLLCATPEGRRAQAAHLEDVAARGLPGMVGAAAGRVIEGIARDLGAGLGPAQTAERAAARAAGEA